MEEQELYRSHPLIHRNHPFVFLFTTSLIVGGYALMWLVKWWGPGMALITISFGVITLITQTIVKYSTTLIVTDQRAILRKGILGKDTIEVFHSNVRNIHIKQTVLQRIFGVGYIGIASAGQSGFEIEMHGTYDPERVKNLINKYHKETPSQSQINSQTTD